MEFWPFPTSKWSSGKFLLYVAFMVIFLKVKRFEVLFSLKCPNVRFGINVWSDATSLFRVILKKNDELVYWYHGVVFFVHRATAQ